MLVPSVHEKLTLIDLVYTCLALMSLFNFAMVQEIDKETDLSFLE